MVVDNATQCPVKFLLTIKPLDDRQHCLTLEIKTPVMLHTNLNRSKLCNGTKLQIKTLCKHVIKAIIFSDCGDGKTEFILILLSYHHQQG